MKFTYTRMSRGISEYATTDVGVREEVDVTLGFGLKLAPNMSRSLGSLEAIKSMDERSVLPLSTTWFHVTSLLVDGDYEWFRVNRSVSAYFEWDLILAFAEVFTYAETALMYVSLQDWRIGPADSWSHDDICFLPVKGGFREMDHTSSPLYDPNLYMNKYVAQFAPFFMGIKDERMFVGAESIWARSLMINNMIHLLRVLDESTIQIALLDEFVRRGNLSVDGPVEECIIDLYMESCKITCDVWSIVQLAAIEDFCRCCEGAKRFEGYARMIRKLLIMFIPLLCEDGIALLYASSTPRAHSHTDHQFARLPNFVPLNNTVRGQKKHLFECVIHYAMAAKGVGYEGVRGLEPSKVISLVYNVMHSLPSYHWTQHYNRFKLLTTVRVSPLRIYVRRLMCRIQQLRTLKVDLVVTKETNEEGAGECVAQFRNETDVKHPRRLLTLNAFVFIDMCRRAANSVRNFWDEEGGLLSAWVFQLCDTIWKCDIIKVHGHPMEWTPRIVACGMSEYLKDRKSVV